jgi:Uma2 family endonuclease
MTVTAPIDVDALFEALTRIEGKAEIVRGEIVPMSPTGPWPSYSAAIIFMSLFAYAKRVRTGVACTDGNTFRVDLPQRHSFSPDAAYFIGRQRDMQYFEGAPQFAVEVRSAGDYGPRAERLMAEKRADYFAAGTQVVWDVDLLSNDVVRVYRAASPELATVYRPGETAEAEPAAPGWSIPVNDLLPEGWSPPATLVV